MIIGFFINIFFNFLNFIFGFLPTGTLPTDVSNGISYIVGVVYMFDAFIPVGTFLTLLGLSFLLQIIVQTYKLSMYIISLIRGN